MIALLSGHSLTVADRFQAEKLSISLSERGSTASMTLSNAAPALTVGQWIRSESGPGAGIVWRIKSIDSAIEKATRTVQLEHMIMALRDSLMFGEIKSSDISGSSANPTARQAAVYILARQSDWTLGDCAYSVSNPYSFNGDDLYSALETVSSSLDGCLWEYDFSVYPFRLHIHQQDDSVRSEMRLDRNIQTLKVTVDRSRMYTRIYPIGKQNLHISGEYLSKNENLYGTISKTETDQSLDTDAKLRAWAQERLDRHCEPIVTVTISGLELAEATGESLDSFAIGRICRVPLPEIGDTITERVTKLAYSDVISTPEVVTITLANELPDVATILKQQSASGGKSSRTGAKNSEEDHAWIVDTTDKVELVAEAVAGKDGDGADWSRVASLTVDGNGIDARVIQTEGGLIAHESRIAATESAIDLEVTQRKSADNSLSGRINVQSSKISLVVEEKNGQNVIKAASILASINDDGSSIVLDADKIDINGVVSALDSYNISCGNITCGNVNGQAITAEGAVGGATGWFDEGVYVNDEEMRVVDATVSGNTLTITKTDGEVITFSKAASLSGVWSGGTVTVTASPQGSTWSSSLASNLINGSWTNNKTYTGDVAYVSGENYISTGRSVTVDTTASYNAGQNSVNVSKGSWSGGVVQLTPSAGSGSGKEVRLTAAGASWSGNTASVELWDGTGADAQHGVDTGYTVTVDASGRYTAGQNSVSVSKGSWGSGILPISTSAGTGAGATVQLTAASASWSGNTASVKIWDGTAADAQHGSDTGYTVTVDASGRYTAGQNSVNVSKGSWSSGICALTTSAGTGTGATVQLVAASATWSSNTASVKIWDGTAADAQHGSDTGYTVTVDASARYTAGQNSVSVSKGAWSGGLCSLTPSAGTGSGATVQLVGASATWSGNTASVKIWDGTAADAQHGSDTGYTISVDASARYTAGQNAVSIGDPTWSSATGSSVSTNSNTATFSTNAPTPATKSLPIFLSAGSWSSGSRTIYASHTDSTEANRIAKLSVSVSPTASVTLAWTGSISGRTSLGSATYTSLHNTYLLIDAKAGGATKKYYITIN